MSLCPDSLTFGSLTRALRCISGHPQPEWRCLDLLPSVSSPLFLFLFLFLYPQSRDFYSSLPHHRIDGSIWGIEPNSHVHYPTYRARVDTILNITLMQLHFLGDISFEIKLSTTTEPMDYTAYINMFFYGWLLGLSLLANRSAIKASSRTCFGSYFSARRSFFMHLFLSEFISN